MNWRGRHAATGGGGWAEKGGEDWTRPFRFVCPNNPAVRRKTVGRLRDLLDQYDFAGVFLDKIRFPSPANGVQMKSMLSGVYCGHCRDAAKGVGLDLDLSSSKSSQMARSTLGLCDRKQPETETPHGLRRAGRRRPDPFALLALPVLASASPRSSRSSPSKRAAHGAEGFARPVLALPCPPGRPGLPGRLSSTATGDEAHDPIDWRWGRRACGSRSRP